MLPFESHSLTAVERPEINNAAVAHMNPSSDSQQMESSSVVVANDVQPTDSSQTWEPIDAPSDSDGVDLTSRMTIGLPDSEVLGTVEEISDLADIDMQLAEMDSASSTRDDTIKGVEPPVNPEHRSELSSIEDELSDLEL